MAYLKLHRDEPETQAPPPLPFEPLTRTWRSTGTKTNEHAGEPPMDSIEQVEQALSRVESTFETLSEQVEELCEPIRMSDWLDSHDDGPWAA